MPAEPPLEGPSLEGRRRFGRYTLLYRFAGGGMANLYLARLAGADGFTKLVAIKLIHDHLANDPDFIKMFIDEARLVSRITHPNVAQVIELGKVGQTHFMAMEYVEGESVGALLRRIEPPRPCSARIIADAAAGLHAAHELRNTSGQLLDVVHRDLSPQNILVGYDGAVRVVDFGIARAKGSLHTTADGSVKGKFSHMAPEQATSAPVDRRADIFVLGVVLYELTTSRRLFKGDSDAETLNQVLNCDVTPPSQVVFDYPAGLEAIVMKCLRPDPADRYQTALELRQALERYMFDEASPVLSSDVGTLISEVFADRIEEKQLLLAQHADATDPKVPTVEIVDASGGELPSGRHLQPARTGGARAAVAIAVVLLGALAAWLIWGRQTATVSPPAAPPPAAATRTPQPSRVKIRIEATPASATISLDGETVPNPFAGERARGTSKIAATIEADGHEPQHFEIPLAEGGTWTIALRPLTAPAAGVAAKTAPPRRRRAKRHRSRPQPRTKRKAGGRKQLADDDVLVNPYR